MRNKNNSYQLILQNLDNKNKKILRQFKSFQTLQEKIPVEFTIKIEELCEFKVFLLNDSLKNRILNIKITDDFLKYKNDIIDLQQICKNVNLFFLNELDNKIDQFNHFKEIQNLLKVSFISKQRKIAGFDQSKFNYFNIINNQNTEIKLIDYDNNKLSNAFGSYLNYKIMSIDISENQVNYIGIEFLSKLICNNALQMLHTIKLSRNNIGDLGIDLLCISIQKSGIRITNIDLSYNNFKTDGLNSIGLNLLNQYCLEKLDLSGNLISLNINYLVKYQNEQSNLRYLKLSNNKIGMFGAMSISEFVLKKFWCKIEILDLDNNFIDNLGADYIASALKSNHFTRLQELNLSDNKIIDFGPIMIFNTIFEKTRIRHFKVSNTYNNAHRSNANSTQQRKFSQDGILNWFVSSKNVQKNKIVDPVELLNFESLIISEIILTSQNFRIKQLDLSSNDISPYGGEIIAKSIFRSNYCKINSLNLADNKIGSKGASMIAKAYFLQLPKYFKEIYLNKNLIDVDGIVSVANSFISNPYSMMEYIDISENIYGQNGSKSIVMSLLNNTNSKLRKLKVSLNLFEGNYAYLYHIALNYQQFFNINFVKNIQMKTYFQRDAIRLIIYEINLKMTKFDKILQQMKYCVFIEKIDQPLTTIRIDILKNELFDEEEKSLLQVNILSQLKGEDQLVKNVQLNTLNKIIQDATLIIKQIWNHAKIEIVNSRNEYNKLQQ